MSKPTTRLYGAFAAAVLAGLAAVLFSFRSSGQQQALLAPVRGRNNTVLLLMSEQHGLGNVHLATAQALLENHPWVDVHVASFAKTGPRVDRVSSFVARKQPGGGSAGITFHELPGPDYGGAIMQAGKTIVDHAAVTPGWAGISAIVKDLQLYLAPWSAEDHYAIYQAINVIVADLDPAVLVLDSAFRPAIDAARDGNRLHVMISPNTVADVFVAEQPYGKALWKYPAMGSGIDFPVPWHLIPLNVALTLHFAYGLSYLPVLTAKRAFLAAKGLRDPINFFGLHRPDVPWLTQGVPEASLPVDVMPPNVTCIGPVLVSVAPAAEQDPDLAAWLAQKPTVLINLGSTVSYSEKRATAMVRALVPVLDKLDGIQVLWKLMKEGNYTDASLLAPIRHHVDSGRVRIERWLSVDPTAILETGHVAAFVHHGGAGCYHEGLWTGVPQVVLPLWVDLYSFATLVEYLGIGVWASRGNALEWDSDELSAAIFRVLDGSAPSSKAMAEKAKSLSRLAQSRGPGRDHAAREVARLAATGY